MKTNTVAREVTTNAGESAAFKISNNAKIFRLLIDGLYADKIQSITREIWSNALDAHVAAGCPERPFDVSFPSIFDPTFRVRDYGISLSHEQVMHMYTDLGHSTKEDTNDAVGKFGIGSKSPFAYTDNFTVTVWKDGEKRFYSAMIGSDGVPAIHLMGVEETDEENGVEVAFPVESSDTRAFQNAAKRVSHGFDVKPNVVGGEQGFGGWPELNVLLEGEGWKLLNGNIDGYQSQAYARMGPVLYPINADALPALTSDEAQLLNHTFVIEFPMGALEITASREALSYGRNDPTAASIKERVSVVAEEVAEIARKSLEEAETYFDACVVYRDMCNSSTVPAICKKLVANNPMWKGRKLMTTISPTVNGAAEVCVLRGQKLDNKQFRFGGFGFVEAYKKTVIFVEDLTGKDPVAKSGERIKRYYNQNRSAITQLIWMRVYSTEQTADLLAFFDTFDGLEVVTVNDLPEPPKPVRQSYGGSGSRRPVEARMYLNRRWDARVTLTDEDFKNGGIYLPLDRNTALTPAGSTSPDHLIRCLRDVGALDQRVIGAPKSMIKKFAGDQWVNLYDFARDWFEKQNFDVAAANVRKAAVYEVMNDGLVRFIRDCVAQESRSELLQGVLDLRDRAAADTTPDPTKMRDLAYALRIDFSGGAGEEKDDFAVELDLYREEIEARYPLLPMLARSNVRYDDNVLDKVTEYVNMCDNVSETNHQVAIAA